MKVTKSQLKQIIKEELEEAQLPAGEKSQKTNMNRSLREFAKWVLKIDGHIESLSGQHMTAAQVPSDINLYDLWLTGASPDGAAQDLTTRDY